MLSQKTFTFDRFGRAYHLNIATGEDLRRVLEFDEALWVATSAPLENLHADATFLDLLDLRGDHRIGVTDVRAAIRWLLERLHTLDGVREGHTTLELAHINTEIPDGKRIYDSAVKILRGLGTPEASTIDLAQVRGVKKAEESRAVEKAGATIRGNAFDPELQRFLVDVLGKVGSGSQPGEGGKTKLERFLLEAETYVNWWAESQSPEGKAKVLPLGEDTAAVCELCRSLQPKIDQYFALADAVRIDPSLAQELWPWPTVRKGLDFSSAEAVRANLRDASLALPDAQGVIDPEGELNPFYAVQFRQLLAAVPDSRGEFRGFDRSDWKQVQSLFAPYEAWLAAKPETPMADLGSAILKRYVEESSLEEVRALISRGRETTLVLDSVRLLEKLILFQAWLLPFVNSFVSFPDLYDPARRALFETGTLVIDGRHLNLSVRVVDRDHHAKISDSSNMFVLYTKIFSQQGEELYEVAVPVTAGGRGTLQVHKRGIFIDVKGREYDAVVVQIVENPISLSEAMIAPFKLLGATITGRIEKITEKAQEKLKETSADAVDWIGQPSAAAQKKAAPEATPKAKPPTPQAAPAAAPSKAGLLAGGGIAIAALGSSLAFIIDTLSSLDLRTTLVGLSAALLGILVPVSIVAILKLSKRDLSAILEGSGWAINARMHLTRRQARSFTFKPAFPAGSKGIRHRSWWYWVLLIAAGLACLYYFLGYQA